MVSCIMNMEQSITSMDHLDNDIVEISRSDTNQSQLPEMEKLACEIISDDEVQIICVKKQDKHIQPLIKIESGDEEVEKKEEKHMSGVGKSLVMTEEGEGSINNEYDCDPQSKADTRCNSPRDVTCSICLGKFDNKSFLDQCFHAFCFYCILQWSEIVRTCPLCKASFSSIIHSVKSMMEYELHRLPAQRQHSKQKSIGVRSMGHIITVDDNAHRSQQDNAARSSNLREWRTHRRERRISFARKKQAEAKKKRKSIYANNLWVQKVTQRGRARFRDTSPQFFHDNPACTHRLVPWLTRELSCLLDEDHRHVDFLVQLIMTLITRLEIVSEEFIQQLYPFLFENTHHFAHEFLSFARSPYDMPTYDERAQYECLRTNGNQDSSATPFIVNTSITGWDSPDEFGTLPLSPSTSSPGPSGLSGSTLFSNRSWSPPLTSEPHPLTDDSTSAESLLHQEVTIHRTFSSPNQNISDFQKLSHQLKGKGKRCSNKSDSTTTGSNAITISSWESAAESHSDIVVSSEETSSPSVSQVKEENHTPKSIKKWKRRSSSDLECSSLSRSKSLQDYHNTRSKKFRRKHSHDSRYRKSRSPSRVSRRPRRRTVRSRSPAAAPSGCDSPDLLASTVKGKCERPSTPTEEEIKREISELERKIADDTKRLTELLEKQEKRRLGNVSVSTKVLSTTEDSGTDELSR